jgi:predicted metalloprotease with PDZ domain
MKILWRFLATLFIILGSLAFGEDRLITLKVDATDTSRQILHATLTFPVRPGSFTLLYPKWIPGEHGPTGPINEMVNLKLKAGEKAIEWRRDPEDMYAFKLELPADAQDLVATFDFLLPSGSGGFSAGASSTGQLLDLSWNHVVLYPKGGKASELQYSATLRLPSGWKYGTALSVARETPDEIEFNPVSLEALVDSTLIAGKHFRTVDLSPGTTPPHWLHIVADSASALELKPEAAACFSRLIPETERLFGARHYRSYHFLLTLSDHVAHFGLEHHESSDNRMREKYLTDEDEWKLGGILLPHEMVHSWNGKYRRPAGLTTPDFQQPMESELLWLYEGLTDYLGEVLAARTGIWTNDTFREDLALTAAMLDHQIGREWRPLADTSIAAQLLYGARLEGGARRRGVDFYPEGDLIWLEADIVIRQQSQGQNSLDDFCKRFFGGESGPPKVVPYVYDDVVRALNETVSYDWNDFFQKRVYAINPRAPLGGVEGSGWRVGFTNVVPELLKTREGLRKVTILSYSIGLSIKEDGGIIDVVPDSPADNAGIGAGMKLVAVDGRRWKPESLRAAIKAAQTNQEPLELLLEKNDFFKTCKIDYHEGEKYPCLIRNPAKPDLLTEILKPRSAELAREKKE